MSQAWGAAQIPTVREELCGLMEIVWPGAGLFLLVCVVLRIRPRTRLVQGKNSVLRRLLNLVTNVWQPLLQVLHSN